MSNKAIKGITIKLGYETTGLEKALKDINKETSKTQKELSQVNKLLQFNPQSTELLAQKQELLSKQIQQTTTKLDSLRQAQQQVEEKFRIREIGEEAYRQFQRELVSTESKLNTFKNQLASLQAEQQRMATSTKQLQTFFEATGTTVDDFANSLGSKLTNAIRGGTATADQLELALKKIGQAALGTDIDIDKFKQALNGVDDGKSLKKVQQDLSQVAKEANKAEDAVNDLGIQIKDVVAGLSIGGGLAGAVSQALDVSTLNTKIDITFDVPESSKKTIKDAVREIETYGIEGEEALEGVRRQWALNANATDEANLKVVKGASLIASAYTGIDFIELIQEVNEVAGALEISNEEALALTNALLKAGFPPEQLDTIAEYGQQMHDIGFTAQEIQAIFEAGIDTKTWNIDNLNDGVKEARILMAEFGYEVDKSMKELLSSAGMSADKFQAWGQAVASGGSEGSKAMAEMVTWLDTIEDSTVKNEIAVKVFGTKWEDQGQNLISVFKGLNDVQDKTTQNMDELNNAIAQMDSSPAVLMKQAFADIKTALEPALSVIAEIVASIAKWASENSTLTAIIVAVTSAIGMITAGASLLAPIITALSTSGVGLSAVLSALTGPIGLTVAAITALGTAITVAYTQSESFREKVNEVFTAIQSIIETVISIVVEYLQEKLETIKQFWAENGEQIMQAVDNAFNFIKSVIEFVMPFVKALIEDTWNAIKNVIDGALNIIMGVIKTFSSLLTGDFSGMWEGIKQIFSGAVEAIWGLLQLGFLGKIFKVIKGFGGKAIDVITDMAGKFKGKFDDILSSAKSKFDAVKDAIMTPINKVKDGVKEALDKIFGFFRDLKLPEIKIPKIKLPHFKIKGDFSLSPPSVPTFSVDWYAKGGILTKPTIFGINGNSLMVGGEAGKEAVLPLTQKVLAGIGQGIVQNMQHSQNIYIQPAPIILDGQQIGEITFNTINQKMYATTNITALTKGVQL
ncbi:replication protein [Ureibacillus sp. FSL W8-0352]|uniref:replication protein n=1 Tax=Ureibacillus sp. FSL W8-0352 TaxID=2954596 RepID=UPI0030F530C3